MPDKIKVYLYDNEWDITDGNHFLFVTIDQMVRLRNRLTGIINDIGYETTARVNFHTDTRDQVRIKALEKQLSDIQNILNGPNT